MGVYKAGSGAALVAVFALTGCTPSRPSAQLAAQLARDAAPLMGLCATKQGIAPSQWPASFASAGVESAYIGYGGLYIETDRIYVQEAGVFIPCEASKFVSSSKTGEDPVYLKVAEGVFTYFIAG
jgi:hypothetical protein